MWHKLSNMQMIRFLIYAALLTFLVGLAYFGWRYFFDPRGISLAPAHICTSNETDTELVFSVEAIPGAKITALLGKGERVCAASPISDPAGLVMAGESEDMLLCRIRVTKPD